ncbi:hypothetical protein BH10CYA1_BH10CYA1_57650 [soil metagenome]
MRTATQLLSHRPDEDHDVFGSRDEREKAMRWRRKESSIKVVLMFVAMAGGLCFGSQNALFICAFMCSVMICARIHEWIPSEKSARLNGSRPTRVLTNNGSRDLVLWLSYDPPNLLQRPLKMFGTASGVVQGLFCILLLIFFIQYGFIAVCFLLLVGLVIGFYVNLAIDRNERISRAQILVTKDGIGFDYSGVGVSEVVPPIDWYKIESVTFAKSKSFWSENTVLQLRVSIIDWPQDCENILKSPGNFFVEREGIEQKLVLNLRSDGFASNLHRRDLIGFITDSLPPEKIIGRHVEIQRNQQQIAHSYTELWLGAFTSKSSRIRRDDLSAQTALKLGKYVVQEQLGAGGQGVAYLALASETGQPVVLKEFVLPCFASETIQIRALEHVQKEASLLQQLQHPQIVKYLDFFVEDQRAYLVLEHIEGMNLRSYVRENGPCNESKTIELTLQLCSILEYLHGLSTPVIHRDFTPDNLMFSNFALVKLIDFNVAQQLESANSRTVVGKHAYLPPEQFRGKATIRSDVYALGATMFFLLTGNDPEPISTSHPKKIDPSISEDLDAIVARATETSEQNRYPDSSALRADVNLLLCQSFS